MPQIGIIHLSDIHFGKRHRFWSEMTPGGDRGVAKGRVSLLDSLRADWETAEVKEVIGHDGKCPVVIAVSGDLAEECRSEEFDNALVFLEGLTVTPISGKRIPKENIFAVPGNHDVIYSEPKLAARWPLYCALYQRFFGRTSNAHEAEGLSRVFNRADDLGLIFAELNSCAYVEKDTPDESRGQIDEESIRRLQDELKAVSGDTLRRSIRVAMIHHHPVLLPALAEPRRGYDSVIRGGELLTALRDFGFHLILHGHKHVPYTFSYDPTCAWTSETVPSMLIVAGGSAGSSVLPHGNTYNTYNLIVVKWDDSTAEARVKVVTRGLSIYDQHNRPLNAGYWKWKTLRVLDRVLGPRHDVSPPGPSEWVMFDPATEAKLEEQRHAQYAHLRMNMPVVEVRPSLDPTQAYEAQVQIVPHRYRGKEDIPDRVVWSAGPKFQELAICRRENNPNFSAVFSYWGNALIQASLHFTDGTSSVGYVYAWLPTRET
jgi:3',5'-cyclic AMP phosphodiesterase CpdA